MFDKIKEAFSTAKGGLDLLSMMGSGPMDEQGLQKMFVRILSNPYLVNLFLNRLGETWAEWEQKEAYQFTITIKREVVEEGQAPELVVGVWALEDGMLKPYKKFTKRNLNELIQMFTNGEPTTAALPSGQQ